MLGPEIVGATELFERFALNSPIENLLRGDADIRLVLDRTQRTEERAFGKWLDDDDTRRGLYDASRFLQGPRHGWLRDMMKGVEEDRAIEGMVCEWQRLRTGRAKRSHRNGLPRSFQRFAVWIDPGNARSLGRQRTRESTGAAADVEDLLPRKWSKCRHDNGHSVGF